MSRLIGGHVSIAGGLPRAIDIAKKLGCNAIQIFGSSPQTWVFRMPPKEDILEFVKGAKKEGVRFIVLHSIYLINLSTEDKGRRQKAIDSLINYLELGRLIGADGVVTHIGTATGTSEKRAIENSATAIISVLEGTPGGIPLMLEITAGSGNTIGSKFEHIAEIIKKVRAKAGKTNSDRIRVCLDTAHVFASGYDLANKLDNVLSEFDRLIGLGKIMVIHFNDSKTELGSKVDRHENLGKGKIGLEVLKRIANHQKLLKIPLIMEVPGFDGDGVDLRNMSILRKMVE